MFFKGVAEEGGDFVTSLMLVLCTASIKLVLVIRGARRGARGVGAVRWFRVALLGLPKLGSTYCLDVRKSEVLVVVQVVEDLVVCCAKGAVVGGFEGSQNDGPKNIVVRW